MADKKAVGAPKPVAAAPQMMLDPNGSVVPVPADYIKDAVAQGYSPATPEQVKDFELQEKYGQGLGNEAKAFGAGVLRGPTLGLSDKALTATGLSTPEALREREERNPAASMAGEATGIVGASLLTGGADAEAAGAGALKKAAGILPSNLVSSAGKAVERVAAKALPEAGESLASRILAKGGAKAAGSAIEGAFYSGGHEISEQALGDPNQTAQSVIAHIGLGGLFGGALGGLTGVAEEGVPFAVKKAKDAIGNLYKKAEGEIGNFYGKAGEEGVNGTIGDTATVMLQNKQTLSNMEAAAPGITETVGNATPEMAKWFVDHAEEIQPMLQGLPKMAAGIARVDPATADYFLANWDKVGTDTLAQTRMAKDIQEGLQKVVDSVDQVSRHLNRDLAPEEARQLLANADPVKVSAAYDRAYDSVTQAVDRMKAEPELYSKGYTRKLELIGEGLLRDSEISGDPVATFERLKTLRQQLDETIPYGKNDMGLGLSERQAVDELKALRKEVKATLTSPEIFGEAGARRAAQDEALSNLLQLTQRKGLFRSKFLREVAGRGGTKFEVDPTKVETWLRQMGKAKGEAISGIYGKYISAAKSLVDEADQSAKHILSTDVDHKAVVDLINKQGDLIRDARERAAVTGRYLAQIASPSLGFDLVAGSGEQMGGQVANAALKHLPSIGAGVGGAIGGLPGAVAGNVLGKTAKVVLEAGEKLKQVPQTVKALAWLERTGQQVSKKIDSAVSTLVRGGVKASYIGRGEVAAGLANHAAKSYEESVKDFEKKTEKVGQLSNSMDALHGAISESTDPLAEHAPNVATALSMAQTAAVNYLAGQIPRHQKAGLMDAAWKPTRAEIGKYNDIHHAVHNPLSILKGASAGTLTPHAVKAVATVYPDLFGKMQASLMNAIAGQKSVPHKSRLGIGLILNTPIDGSYAPASIRASQAVFAPTQAPQQGPKATSAGAAKLTLSNRFQTPLQQAINRTK
jgi:uncharacterized protein (DUF697 family)